MGDMSKLYGKRRHVFLQDVGNHALEQEGAMTDRLSDEQIKKLLAQAELHENWSAGSIEALSGRDAIALCAELLERRAKDGPCDDGHAYETTERNPDIGICNRCGARMNL